MNLIDAAQIVLAEVRKHEAFTVAAQALQSIGSLDQALAESQARIDKSRQDELDAGAALAKAQDAVQAALDQADKVRADADAYRLTTHETAHRDAEQTGITSRTSADSIIADATARRQAAEDSVSAAQAALATLEPEIVAKQAAMADLTAQLDALRAKIA